MRVTPALPAAAMKTYTVLQPIGSHFRPATCAEVGCERHAKGWNSALNMADPKHVKAAYWIRMQSGRSFTVVEAGPIVTFTFPAGQDCFAKHHLPVDRPALFVIRGGDFRGNPRRIPVQRMTDADWLDDFRNHQQKLADRLEQG